jgi:hypothetical protein
MVQRLYSFLVVFLLIFSGEIFGQQFRGKFSAPTPSYSVGFKKITPSLFRFPANKYLGNNDCTPGQTHILLNILPSSFYSANLGFICKKELQLDKVIAVPLRFRLGSLAYVNYLEQKPNAHNPQR